MVLALKKNGKMEKVRKWEREKRIKSQVGFENDQIEEDSSIQFQEHNRLKIIWYFSANEKESEKNEENIETSKWRAHKYYHW